MRILLFIHTLFCLFVHTGTLKCISSTNTVTITSEEYNLDRIKQKINALDLQDKYEKCLVSIVIEYESRNIQIFLNPDDDQITLMLNKEINVKTGILIAMNGIAESSVSVINAVVFQCDDKDGCDKKFLLDHIEWLFKFEGRHLHSSIEQILNVENTTKGSCFILNWPYTKRCLTSVCYMGYNFQENETIVDCDELSRTPIALSLSVIVQLSNEDENLKITSFIESIQFWCQTDFCNQETIGKQVKQAVHEHYDISMMYQVLENNFKLNQTSPSIYNSTVPTSEQLQNHPRTSFIIICSLYLANQIFIYND